MVSKETCLQSYEMEKIRQENPYFQWISEHEINHNTTEKGSLYSVKRMLFSDFEGAASFQNCAEDILLLCGTEGHLIEDAEQYVSGYFEQHPETNILYADEDEMDRDTGVRDHPWFKPSYAPDTLLASFYFGNVVALRVSYFQNIVWLEAALGEEGNEKLKGFPLLYDYILQAAEHTDRKMQQEANYCDIKHLDYVLFHHNQSDTSQNILGAQKKFHKVKREALKRRNVQGKLAKRAQIVENEEKVAGNDAIKRKKEDIYHICYEIKEQPLVSVVIPSKNHAKVVQKCLTSFLQYTTYQNVEFIIVDNGSSEEEKTQLLQNLAPVFENRKQDCFYLYQPQEFNFSAICNYGASKAHGTYILFLNDDVEIIESEWLDRMLGQAMQKRTGAVGAKLLYPDSNQIQHVGITNMGIGPAHKLNGFADDTIYYHGQNRITRNCIAVTAACLLVEKTKFDQVGGFPEDLKVAYNDVALCFALLQAGYLNVVRNDAVLVHHESLSRGIDDAKPSKRRRLLQEKHTLYKKYPQYQSFDPFYSKQLVQMQKDTDYHCNYEFLYERADAVTNLIEAEPELIQLAERKVIDNKLVKKLLQNGTLMGSIERINEHAPETETQADGQVVSRTFQITEENLENVIVIEGWSLIQERDNAMYEPVLVWKKEQGGFYQCETFQKRRRDVEETFSSLKNTDHLALTGFVCRIPCDAQLVRKAGVYQLGIASRNKVTGAFEYISFQENNTLLFLESKGK